MDVRIAEKEVPVDFSKDTEYGAEADIRIGIFSRHHGMRSDHGMPRTEFVQVQSPSISFAIFPSHAGNEFRDDADMREKYSHLDWMTLDMVGVESYKGVLPEIWGVRTVSPEVSAMLVAPSKRGSHQGCSAETCPRVAVA